MNRTYAPSSGRIVRISAMIVLLMLLIACGEGNVTTTATEMPGTSDRPLGTDLTPTAGADAGTPGGTDAGTPDGGGLNTGGSGGATSGGTGDATNLGDVIGSPEMYNGQGITVTGRVDQLLGTHAFTLTETEGAEQALLVLVLPDAHIGGTGGGAGESGGELSNRPEDECNLEELSTIIRSMDMADDQGGTPAATEAAEGTTGGGMMQGQQVQVSGTLCSFSAEMLEQQASALDDSMQQMLSGHPMLIAHTIGTR